ncbi:MAG TPA: hypothetical protein VJS37_10990 [Terriglobales bacterium]|nr:hypothetical protein [Terriglobales bacterium]
MEEQLTSARGSALPSTIANSLLGGVIGGTLAAALVIGFTEILKGMLAVVSRQHTWVIILAPLIGLALSVLVLYGFGWSSEADSFEGPKWMRVWRAFRLALLARI